MITINGKPIGEFISKQEKIDETKTESAYYIKEIHINSYLATVKVSACGTGDISAHLHGMVSNKQDVTLRMVKDLDKITISVNAKDGANGTTQISIGSCNVFVGSSNSFSINNINIDSSTTSGLLLDVKIPVRLFKKLFINNNNGNVIIHQSVNVEELDATCKNGNLEISILPRLLKASSKNGNVSITATAKCNSKLNVSGKNGNVHAILSNIESSTVEVTSKNGNVKNKPRLTGSYSVSGCISSKNGNAYFS